MTIPLDIQAEIHRRLDAAEGLLPELQRLLTGLQSEDLHISTKSSRRDLVTRADVASEQTILHFIKSLFPGDGILAEESGQHTPEVAAGSSPLPSGISWCIDPVDGTVNYAHGLPLYAVSIGILYREEPAGGIVFLPALGDVYRATTGAGATKNGKRIHVSTSSDMESSLIVTGFPYNRSEMLDLLANSLRAVLAAAHCVRRTGTAALDLCWVAEGRFDGYYEWNLSPWDTSAGVVILREAGGMVTTLNGNAFRLEDKFLLASNGIIHGALAETLRSVDPVR